MIVTDSFIMIKCNIVWQFPASRVTLRMISYFNIHNVLLTFLFLIQVRTKCLFPPENQISWWSMELKNKIFGYVRFMCMKFSNPLKYQVQGQLHSLTPIFIDIIILRFSSSIGKIYTNINVIITSSFILIISTKLFWY